MLCIVAPPTARQDDLEKRQSVVSVDADVMHATKPGDRLRFACALSSILDNICDKFSLYLYTTFVTCMSVIYVIWYVLR